MYSMCWALKMGCWTWHCVHNIYVSFKWDVELGIVFEHSCIIFYNQALVGEGNEGLLWQ